MVFKFSETIDPAYYSHLCEKDLEEIQILMIPCSYLSSTPPESISIWKGGNKVWPRAYKCRRNSWRGPRENERTYRVLKISTAFFSYFLIMRCCQKTDFVLMNHVHVSFMLKGLVKNAEWARTQQGNQNIATISKKNPESEQKQFGKNFTLRLPK